MYVSVILSTYDSPEWLSKVIWGYAAQTYRRFEIVIADDGSCPRTAERIEQLRRATKLKLVHVWHPKRGFRKCRILNRAILAAKADYLIFSDADCIPRRDFVAEHVRLATLGRLLSGGRLKLTRKLSDQITIDDIVSGRITSRSWLRAQGCLKSRKLLRLAAQGRMAAMLDATTTTRATFNGHNTSVWKQDVLRVNGFDERLGYGGLDRELGERLVNAGVRPRQIRHRAICVHLDHSQNYIDPAVMAGNRKIRDEVCRNRLKWTPYGIDQHLDSEANSDDWFLEAAPIYEEIGELSFAV
ncbi:MAG TPA: glycosyltransferase family 2 protein [Pirellulales bacterium]|jgi:glycosyltransferase involved in cell wall biosynthesis